VEGKAEVERIGEGGREGGREGEQVGSHALCTEQMKAQAAVKGGCLLDESADLEWRIREGEGSDALES